MFVKRQLSRKKKESIVINVIYMSKPKGSDRLWEIKTDAEVRFELRVGAQDPVKNILAAA